DAHVHGEGHGAPGRRGERRRSRRRGMPGRQPGRRGQADGDGHRCRPEAGLIAMGLLDGRVAVVTGSGRGIGREFALCMAREGARLVVNDVGVSLDGRGTDEDPAAQVCKEIEALGGQATPNYDSVSDFDGAGGIIRTAVDTFGQLDVLVNNAGIVRDRTLVKMNEDDFDSVIGVHLKGSFNCAHHAAVVMKDAGYGRIINVTSSAGLRGNFGQTNYGAAKAGLMGMTFIWALELGKYGITVNAVAPAGATRMTAGPFERPSRRDCRPVGADGGATASRAEPRAQRAARRLPLLGTGESRQRPDPRPHRLRVHDLPASQADRVDVARRWMGAGAGRRPFRPG